MTRRFAVSHWVAPLAAIVLALAPLTAITAQSGGVPDAGVVLERYSPDQIDNLVGPVALYPDALLAQVLVASTFPDQIEEAVRYVRTYGTDGIDDQPWDVSVKAVAHYQPALNMMAEKIDWTTTLGRAYASQSGDVMVSVQRLRAMADAQGNLVSNEQQEVVREVVEQEVKYVIVPAQPQIIYVPTYDPYYVYTRPLFRASYRSPFWSFGVGFPIGSWLIYDFNWGLGSIYYNGWDRSYFGYAGGWRARSYPYVHITNIYVTPRHRTVYVNRNVWNRRVNYGNLNRYASVHRNTRFEPRDADRYNNPRSVGENERRRGDDARNDRTRENWNGSTQAATNARVARTRDAVEAANRSTGASSAERIARTREALSAANQGSGSIGTSRSQPSRQAQPARQEPSSQPAMRTPTRKSSAQPAPITQPERRATSSPPARSAPATQPMRQPARQPAPPARATPSRQPAPARAAPTPARAAPTRAAPTRAAPTRAAPTRSAPARATPTRSAPTRSAPTRSAPTRSAPTRSAPARSAPAPTRATPVRATPTRAAPTRSAPAKAAPARSAPAKSAPAKPARKPFSS